MITGWVSVLVVWAILRTMASTCSPWPCWSHALLATVREVRRDAAARSPWCSCPAAHQLQLASWLPSWQRLSSLHHLSSPSSGFKRDVSCVVFAYCSIMSKKYFPITSNYTTTSTWPAFMAAMMMALRSRQTCSWTNLMLISWFVIELNCDHDRCVAAVEAVLCQEAVFTAVPSSFTY